MQSPIIQQQQQELLLLLEQQQQQLEQSIVLSNDPSNTIQQQISIRFIQQWLLNTTNNNIQTNTLPICINLLRTTQYDIVQLFCLNTISNHLLVCNNPTIYNNSTTLTDNESSSTIAQHQQQQQQQQHYQWRNDFRNYLLNDWPQSIRISSNYGTQRQQPQFLNNKVASIVSKLFLQQVGRSDNIVDTWITVENDFIIQFASNYIDLYLQIIEYILEDLVLTSTIGSITDDASSVTSRTSSSAAATGTITTGTTIHEGMNGGIGFSLTTVGSSSNSNRVIITNEQIRRVKDYLKGYITVNGIVINNNDNPTFITPLQRMFDTVVTVLSTSVVQYLQQQQQQQQQQTAINTKTNIENRIILCLKTIKGFFLWTEMTYLGDTAVHQLIDILIGLVQLLPSPYAPTTTNKVTNISIPIGQLTIDVWNEWMTSSSSIIHTTEQQSNIVSLQDPKLPIIQLLLQRIHESNILPSNTSNNKKQSTSNSSNTADNDSIDSDSSIDTDYIELIIATAQLINSIGVELYPLLHLSSSSSSAAAVQQQQLESLSFTTLFNGVIDLFFRSFAYDDIDVSSAVLPLATRLCSSFADDNNNSSNTNTTNGANTNNYPVENSNKKHNKKVHITLPSTMMDAKTATSTTSTTTNNFLCQHAPTVLNILYKQLRYPIDFSYDFDDEINAEEEQYRILLCKLYTKLVRVAPNLCLQFISEAIAVQWQQQSLTVTATRTSQDIEATLRLLYVYCEGVQPSPGLKVVMKNPVFRSVITTIHTTASTVIHPQQHPSVLCWYYDIAVRYYPIFLDSTTSKTNTKTTKQEENIQETQLRSTMLSNVLNALTGECGLINTVLRVRSRSCYLLLRLVKSVAVLLRPFMETAVSGIQRLLEQQQQQQQHLYQQQQQQPLLLPDDVLNLFETVGILLGKTGLTVQEQQRYLTAVMTPHVTNIQQILQQPNVQVDTEQYGDILASSIAALTQLSKGFNKNAPDEVQSILLETVTISFTVLEALPTCDSVRNKVIVFVQRMIYCGLGIKLLPILSQIILVLIDYSTVDDIVFVAQIFMQLCIQLKNDAVHAIDVSLLPFIRKCHQLQQNQIQDQQNKIQKHNSNNNNNNNHNTAATITQEQQQYSVVAPHIEIEQLAIEKLLFSVIQHIVSHNATSVLFSLNNEEHFEMILITMSDGVIRVTDSTVKKTCFRFFRELLVQLSSSSSSSSTTALLTNNPDKVTVPDSYRYNLCIFINHVLIPRVFDFMLKPSFNERDVNQARTIYEFANLLFVIKSQNNNNNDAATTSTTNYYQQCIYQQIVSSQRKLEGHEHHQQPTTSTGTTSTLSSLSIEIINAFNAANSSNEIEVCLKEYFKVTK